MNLNFITDDVYLDHDTGPHHPENIERYKVVKSLLNTNFHNHNYIKPRLASIEEICSVHDPDYVNSIIKGIPSDGYNYYDPDTLASPKSLNSYLSAVGGPLIALENILIHNQLKTNSVYFCNHRPPGHHAEISKAMGFGVFNNISILATQALLNPNINKILIIDFDVHHGNGTQHIFENNKNIFYASSHQYPFYPGSGSVEEKGVGNIFNCNLISNTLSDDFRIKFKKDIIDKINCNFDLVLFSAGFDAHHRDPLASINLIEDDFYWVTSMILSKFGGKVPVISLLEGGYDKEGLKNGLNSHLKALMEYTKNE